MARQSRKASRLNPITFIQVFSLDVVMASLALASMVNHITHNIMPVAYWFVLPLAVWTIYTLDHLLDSVSGGRKVVSFRHRIHLRYRMALTFIVIITAIASFVIAIIGLDPKLINAGIWLGVFSGAYFLLLLFRQDSNSRFFFKEPIVALVFTAGIWLAPLMHPYLISNTAWYILPMMYLTVMANLILNSIFESSEDKHSGFASVATKIGIHRATVAFYSSIVLSMLIGGWLALHRMEESVMASALILTLVQVGFILIFRHSNWTMKNHRYRFIGDLLFLLSFLTLMM